MVTLRFLWSAFWSKAGAVSIRVKILGIVAVCILVSGLASVWYTYRDDSVTLREQLQQRGIAIGTSLATQSRDLILTDNQFALYKLARDTLRADRDMVYVFVLDAADRVLVHTFDNGFPTDLLSKNKSVSGEPYQMQLLESRDGIIQDVAVPVLGGKAGTVRLGMSEATINAAVAVHVRNILWWVALTLVLGLFIAYGLSSILTEPVARLAEAARATGKGDFKWRTPVWAKDEIGALGDAFSEMRDELKLKEEMRVKLLGKVINAQEEERKRIARELHDETSQALTSLIVGLKFIEDSIKDAKLGEKTAELRALAAETLTEVHHLAIALRPKLLDDLGLDAAIKKYAKDYSAKMNMGVDCHISGLDGKRLPSEVEVTVFRIVQEALTNVARHAKATSASVVLRYRDSSLVAIIEDDGQGFDVNTTVTSADENRLGLFGMYERASLIGGKLTVESQAGSGTAVFLEVPLKLSRKS